MRQGMNVKRLAGMTIQSLKYDGVLKTGKKVIRKIKRKFGKKSGGIYTPKRVIQDVLFVNGCDPILCPHPYRYRVLHQIEQLNSANLMSADVYYIGLNPQIVRDFRIIIFYRCPYTNEVGEAIKLAKKLNKTVLFDVDDLVIDTKYTDLIPYVQGLSTEEKKVYDDGVIRMGKTLKLCDGAITTTEALANELKNYVPRVFINRNRASEEMFALSRVALSQKKHDTTVVKIGYFSGSITHNADFELIKPALLRILDEFTNVKLVLLGELDLPKDLQKYSSQIEKQGFVDWKKLPELIASVDINLAPIEENIFNDAKSENKWVEAALVKVPTVASRFGAFKVCITDEKTGLLCSDSEEWYLKLKKLIINKEFRCSIAENAYNFCYHNYNTISTGGSLAQYLNNISARHVAFVFPSTNISGGLMVALTHAKMLKNAGCDVDILASGQNEHSLTFQGELFNVINYETELVVADYETMIATMWTTVNYVKSYPRTGNKLYLVQNYETDFYEHSNWLRSMAERTYSDNDDLKYITISKWCQNWLKAKYRKNVKYAPNGIELKNFIPHKRNLDGKIRILIEGDNAVDYKNVDESFKIVQQLPKDKFEVWYMSYNAYPKEWYRVDRFLCKVPYEKVGQVYEQCDILIKSSWLESFSYPPLEMMASGGYCIVVPNEGNVEYLKDSENCLFYQLGNIDAAVEKIDKLVNDDEVQECLYRNGIKTAQSRDWNSIKNEILKLYN